VAKAAASSSTDRKDGEG